MNDHDAAARGGGPEGERERALPGVEPAGGERVGADATAAETGCGSASCGCRQAAPPPPLWRDRGELERSEAHLQALERELPPSALPVLAGEGVDRRRFLQLMGASIAFGGATACTRQPLETIVPFVKAPENVIPGQPLFFATAASDGGHGVGVLVESHMGRPTKIEGNPEHPASLGGTDARTQASVLDLYDPDRSQTLVNVGRIRTWSALVDALSAELAGQEGTGGAGLRILTREVTSPTLAAQLQRVLQRFPNARWYQWEAAGDHAAHLAARAAFGRPVTTRYDLAAADVIVTLDCDLLDHGPGAVRYAREFGKRRRVWDNGVAVNRLYAVESTPTCTSTLADHRVALPPAEIGAFAAALAAALGVPGAAAPAGWSHPEAGRLLPLLARDLQAHRGRSVVAAGPGASPEVHVLAHAINEHLGNVGATVVHTEPVAARPADMLGELRTLADELRQGKVEALLVLDANPVYDAPVDVQLAEAMMSPAVRLKVHWGLYQDETAARCHWHVPAAHWLEAWGDVRAFDGTATIQQPLIEPLYGGKSAHELLAILEGKPGAPGMQIVQEQWAARLGGEAGWRRALHDGVVPGSAAPPVAVAVGGAAVAAATSAIGQALGSRQGYVLAFRPDPSLGDGRQANNAWLQEVPKPFTKVTWDNPALVSPRTAREIGVDDGEYDGLLGRRAAMMRVELGGRSLEVPVWVMPGQADGVITLHLGFARRFAGKVAQQGKGFDTYGLRTVGGMWNAGGATATGTGERYELASTQGHFVMEDRPLVRHATLAKFRQNPDFVHEQWKRPADGLFMYDQGEFKYDGYKWGMAINLSACTGCNACVVACQSENNIPVVGKDQVYRGREMHWIRVDQYFAGPWETPEGVYNQPIPCMHCETAPCEVVCPVAATTHSSEGLNDMVYNRCVGTRYCSNNCPYKVRRFNFYKYQDFETESLKLQRNPDVTVRFRGVMEKCTYCVQRINAARIDAEREERRIRDGEVTPACAQACPTEAIAFGDLNDEGSKVLAWKSQPLNYGVLEDINTRPRTTYLGRVNNPHPELEEA
jgi:molybdopterin-containing oxidoreductase family iron-sulfur binding subunit